MVDLGSASDFLVLDIGTDPSNPGTIRYGDFTGDVGWSGGKSSRLNLRATLDGDIYRAPRSSLRVNNEGMLTGTDYADHDMSSFIADVDAAVAQFGALTQDIDLGSIDQSVGLTIGRTDKYTVVDMSVLKMSSGVLTLNGQADDVFYIRVTDTFELSNVDIVVNGTDSSRVFFIYEGTSELTFNDGTALGNIIAPYAQVTLTKLTGFNGSVISGDGFTIGGSNKIEPVITPDPIPEATVLGLIAVIGTGSIFIHRIFRCKNTGSTG